MATCRLTIDVRYDSKRTTADDVAHALSLLLSNAMQTEGVTDEVGPIQADDFEVCIEDDV